MGKAGVILGIIGILVGAGGLGFGIITWMDQSKVNIWNDFEEDIFTPPFAIYATIPNLHVIVNLNSPVQLFVLFSSSNRINTNPGGFADIIYYFYIDTRRLLNPYTRVGPYQGTSDLEYHSATLQYFNASFPAGLHNISVIVWSETTGNQIRECSLTVQTYPI